MGATVNELRWEAGDQGECMSRDSRSVEAERTFEQGQAHHGSGRHEQALESFRHAAGLFATMGDRERQGDALQAAAMLCVTNDRGDEALALLAKIADVFRSEGDHEKLAVALGNLGLLLARQARLEEAIGCFEESQALFEQARNRFAAAQQLGNIGSLRVGRGLSGWRPRQESNPQPTG